MCLVDSPSFLKLLLISKTFSKPPTNSLLRWSSGAILKKSSLSRALCWVIKGLATAPPGMECIIGVSTSRKPSSIIEALIDETIWERLIKISFDSGLLIKSKYRWRYLISISAKPLCFSGIGLRDLVIRTIEWASTVSSSVLVLNKLPSTPIISPRSHDLKFLYKSGSILFLLM